jgi:hypothetical protein
MLFWTVVLFVAYSVIYFVVSQRKMRKLRNNIVTLRTSLQEKSHVLHQSKARKAYYENEMAD